MKMNKAIFFALLLVILFSHAGCSKNWIEVKAQQSQAIPSTLKDFRAILDNPSSYITGAPGLTEVSADYHIYTEANWQNIKNTVTANAYTWSNLNNTAYNTMGDWSTPYTGIFWLNIVLEGLQKLRTTEDTDQLNYLKGEALMYRGRIFYELAMTFSPAYSTTNATKQLGIPIRTISDVEIPPFRSTVQETYDQIIRDLKDAMYLLPENSDVLTHPSRLSAIGFLARVYLAMEKYDSAFVYADNYLKTKSNLVDYNTLPTNSTFIGLNSEISHLNFIAAISGLSNYLIDPGFVAKYDDDDLRKTLFFQAVSGGQYQFKGSYSKAQKDNFCGIATDEIYLIRAECLARRNSLDLALADLNTLLKERYKKVNDQTTYVDFLSDNDFEVLRKILDEREKELILRNIRWSDLKRLNHDSRFAKTLSRNIGGTTYSLEPNNDRYIFPIPFLTSKNENLPQNDGWY